MPCSIVWLRSTKRAGGARRRDGSPAKDRLAILLPRCPAPLLPDFLSKHSLQVDTGNRADTGNGLPDLVVRRRGPGRNSDHLQLPQPLISGYLALCSDRLMPDRPGYDIDRVCILNVVR